MRTGVEIHPAARVGRRCLLLGSGIVVGELAMLGDDCVLHAGVVLTSGGLTPLELARSDAALLPGRGHPSIGNRVRLEAGVLVAGDVFVGNDAVLQVGAVVTRDVPDAAVALGPPCRLMPQADLHADPEVRAIRDMANRLLALEEQVQVLAFQLKRQGGPSWEPRNAATYGPITAVDRLVDSSGLP